MTLDSRLGAAVCRVVLAGTLCELGAVFDRARVRGEVSANADVELLASMVVAFVMHGVLHADAATSATVSLLGFVESVIPPVAASSYEGP